MLERVATYEVQQFRRILNYLQLCRTFFSKISKTIIVENLQSFDISRMKWAWEQKFMDSIFLLERFSK